MRVFEKFAIVVQIISLEEEPDRDSWLERKSTPLQHDELLGRSVARHPEVGHGSTEASLQEAGHDLIVRDVQALDVRVADQDDVSSG